MTDLIRGASKMTDLIEYRSYYADLNEDHTCDIHTYTSTRVKPHATSASLLAKPRCLATWYLATVVQGCVPSTNHRGRRHTLAPLNTLSSSHVAKH
jgi:hypothetical protein